MKIDLGRVVGADGKSAYQIAVEHGFEGTEQEWIDSLNYDDDISALDEKINQEIEDRTNADSNLQNQIDSINEKIPEAATASNQLADKQYVLDKIATNSGNFIGAFSSFEELQNYEGTLVKNDYAFVITVETSLKSYKRYQWTGSEWKFEYDLNNSSFTDEQWDAINSNVTATWKTNVDTELGEIDSKLNGTIIYAANEETSRYFAFSYTDSYGSSAKNQEILIQVNRLNFAPYTILFNATSYNYNSGDNRLVDLGNSYKENYYSVKFYLDNNTDTLYLSVPSYCYVTLKNILLPTTPIVLDEVDSIPDTATKITPAKYALKTEVEDTYATKTDLSGKADKSHTHDDRYYTETEIDSKLSGKVDKNASLAIRGTTYDDVNYGDENPYIEFSEANGSQPVRLSYTSYDAYQSPASITLNGSQGEEYFIAPNIKATSKFYGDLSGNATNANAVNGLETRTYLKNDNSGYPTYRLMWNITDFFNTTINSSTIGSCTTRGFVGFVLSQRENSGWNDRNYHIGYIDMNINYRPTKEGFNLYYTNGNYVPYIIKDTANSNYYLALKVVSGGRVYRLFGRFYNGQKYNSTAKNYTGGSSYVDTEIKATDAKGTLPARYELISTYNSVDLSPKFNNIWNVSEVSKAHNDGSGNNIVDTYATKTELNSHTHSEYHSKTDLNIKNYGYLGGTRYIEVSSFSTFAGVEVNIAYSGKWYFATPGSAPLYFSGDYYTSYGVSGWAWSSDNKKLYLKISLPTANYKPVSISVLGSNANDVSISDDSTSAPSGITFNTNTYDIKAEIDGKANSSQLDDLKKYHKRIFNSTGDTKYYVIKNIPNRNPIQIMGSVSRLDTVDSVFNFTATGYSAQQMRIVGIWNNSALYGQTWKPLPFKFFRQSDNTYNLWAEIPSYSVMNAVMTTYNGTDYSFVESAFDDTGTEAPKEMSIMAHQDLDGNDIRATYALKSDLANAGMSVSAKNVMEATGSIDFNTNKALFQLPIYSAEDTDQPTTLGAMWIQEIKENTK